MVSFTYLWMRHYRDSVLSQHIRPSIRAVDRFFTFHRENAPARQPIYAMRYLMPVGLYTGFYLISDVATQFPLLRPGRLYIRGVWNAAATMFIPMRHIYRIGIRYTLTI